MEEKEPGETQSKPLFAPARQLEWGAPLRWLKLGWQDYKASLRLSSEYGLFFAVGGLAMSVLLFLYENEMFIFSLGFLFVLLGPLFAFGLYDVSRQLQQGETPTLRHSISQIRSSAPNQWVFAIVLIVVALLWMRAATIIHIFYPDDPEPALNELVTFFAIGSGVGALFAGLVFALSAFSLPMMVDRNVDAITAVLSSFNAVMKNKGVAALWAFLIMVLVTLGFATLFLGLIVVLPLIGYATFHGYRESILR